MKHIDAWDLLDAIGDAGEMFAEDADSEHPKKKRKRNYWKYGSIAACAALALTLPVIAAVRGVLPWGKGNTVTETGENWTLHPAGTAGEPGTDAFSSAEMASSATPESSEATGGSTTMRDYLIYYVDESGLRSLSLRLEDTPEERFGAWKTANDIGDEVELLGEEAEDGVYRLTLSGSLRAYYDERKELLLLLSLHRTMADFARYLEGNAVYPDDYPAFVDIYDEQGRLLYTLRPWTDWSIDLTEYDYGQGVCTLSHYLAGGEIEPDITTEPEYILEYVEEHRIDETGDTFGSSTRYTYFYDGTLDSIEEYDENHIGRLYTGYYPDGSIRAIVESDERGNVTKMLYYREDGSFEEHHEVEYDEEGRDRRHTYYDEGGSVEHTELYFFDESGNWAGAEYYNADNVLCSTVKCTYDEQGRRLTEAVYRPDGTLEKLTEYTYSGGSFYTSRSEYYYDEEGNLTSEWHGGENDGGIAGVTGG